MSKGKFAIGALLSAAAGVVAGRLTAPKSGKETRAELKDKAIKVKAEATQKAEFAAKKASDMAEEAKNRVQDVSGNIMTEADELKQRTERAVEGAKKGFFGKEK